MSGEIQIPHYTLVREIGTAGGPVDYLATQEGLDRPVVVRVLRHDQSGGGVDLAKQFEKEGRLLAQLEHESIVRIYEIGSTDEVHYRVMEYLDGGSLLDRMRSGNFTRGHIVYTCAKIAQALHLAHRSNVFHQDLRPSCIMFRGAATPVLTDLGMVRNFQPGIDDSATGVMDPTPRYLSPEQLQGHPDDSRSDVYVLGLLFYYMLTSEFPCQDRDPAQTDMHKVCDLLKPLPDEFSDLQPVLKRMLAGTPEDRYQSMLEFYDDLCSTSPVDAGLTEESFDVPNRSSHFRRKMQIPALGSLLVIVAGLFVAYQFMPASFSEEDKGIVEQELQDFELSMAKMQIYGPVGVNATSSLERMLAISREYYKVREAAHRLADIYMDDAYDSYVSKNLEDAFKLTRKGLEFAPDHEGLAQLIGEIEKDLEQRDRMSQIEYLVEMGNRALAREDLLPPCEDCAYSIFEKLDSLDPGNKAADTGLREIQMRIAEEARSAWGDEGLYQAKQQTLKGLELFPDSVLLNDLMADIERTEESIAQQNG